MKNICLNIMNKGIAPTELKQTGIYLSYKGCTPTELKHVDTLYFYKDVTPMEVFIFFKFQKGKIYCKKQKYSHSE